MDANCAEASSSPCIPPAVLVRRALALILSLALDDVTRRMAEAEAAAPEQWAAFRAEYADLFAFWER